RGPPGRAVVAVWRVGGSIVSPLIVLPACQVWALWESAAQRGPQLAALPPGAATRRARRGGPWVRLVPRRETQAAKRTGDGAPEFLGRGGAPRPGRPRLPAFRPPSSRPPGQENGGAPRRFSFASRARLMCGRGRDGSRVSLPPPPPGRWPRPPGAPSYCLAQRAARAGRPCIVLPRFSRACRRPRRTGPGLALWIFASAGAATSAVCAWGRCRG
ncbi:unnamed protein product, partial [Amoebophrya sp. A120]